MVLLKLYWSFLLIGFGSFGGLSMNDVSKLE